MPHEILGAVHDVTPTRSVVDGGVMVVDGDGYAFGHLAYAEQPAMLDRVLSLWDNASRLGVDRLTVLAAAGEAASGASTSAARS